MSYPILVERFDERHPALAAVCQSCGQTSTWNPAHGDPLLEDARCTDCGGAVVFMYRETERCGVCGELEDCEHRTT